jgi:hypothetical protein
MTLGDIYRDIHSRIITVGVNQSELMYLDIVNAINDVIKQQRVEYVKQGLSDYFATTISFINSGLTQPAEYPYLKQATLSPAPLKDLPLSLVVLNGNAYATENTITNTLQTFTKGSKATKNNDLFVAVESFSGINTFTKTFDPTEVKDYYPENGLSYKVGNVVKDGDSYYRVLQDFTATFDDILDAPLVEKLYWAKTGTAYVPLVYYPFTSVQGLRTFENNNDAAGFTISKSFVFVTPNVTKFSITYVPIWTPVTTMTATLDLPDFMLQNVKMQVLQILGAKLGIDLQTKRVENE